MSRIRFIKHKDKDILLEDFSGLLPGHEYVVLLEEARRLIHSRPEGSVLALFDASDAMFDDDVIGRMKEFTTSNKPYIKTSAVVGITGLRRIALTAVSKFSGRDFKVFDTREEALDWLAEQ